MIGSAESCTSLDARLASRMRTRPDDWHPHSLSKLEAGALFIGDTTIATLDLLIEIDRK